jgi:hypothetical protein
LGVEELKMGFAQLLAGGAALGIAMTGLCLTPEPAVAGYVVTLKQVGSDVVASGSGPVDLSGLMSLGTFAAGSAEINPSFALIVNGEAGTSASYTGFTGPATFGSGGESFPNNTSGDFVAIDPDFGDIDLPSGYVSDSPLSDTSTYDNQTFASLGVTPGTYVWKWGRGKDQNFTLVVPASVPEPSTVLLLVLGAAFAGIPLARARSNPQGGPSRIS